MKYNYLGNTGLQVSALCLGTMQFGWTADQDQSFDILSYAYDSGINFIDTADIYSSWVPGNPGGVAETIIGDWLHSCNIPRDHIILATKVRGRMGTGPNAEGLSRDHILNSVEASLRRLKSDYIDLYQAHWYDEHTPVEETMGTLDDLIRQGKVRYIGCSNHPAWRLTEALWVSKHHNLARYETLQPHYNLVHRSEFEDSLAEVCQKYKLGVMPYSPLAGGFLTGKYSPGQKEDSERAGSARKYFSQSNWALLDLMRQIGNDHAGATPSQIALAWLLVNPLITSPIIGPRTVQQLGDNLKALQLELAENEVGMLSDASDG